MILGFMLKFQKKLQERKSTGSERSLSLFTGFSDFFSNDYLGLSKTASSDLPNTSGSTGSRLLSGNSPEAEQTEKFLADFFQAESALIFNSGYDANLGFFSSVPQRGDTILYDELIHASARDGIRLSYAKSFSFKHNDTEDLLQKIKKGEGTVFVAIESLYSMDGDLAPLAEMVEMCTETNALLVVDEAHSGGIFGDKGNGLISGLNLTHQVFARIFTFGKAYGTHGAAVLGSKELTTYLINFARSFIYTTALPPHQYTTIKSQIEKSFNDSSRIQLQENIAYFRKLAGELISLSDPHSPIQVMLVPGVENAKNLAEKLQENNFAVKAILSPTVAEGKERLRFCMHAFNTKEEIDLIATLIHSSKE